MGDSLRCNTLFYLISIPMDYKPKWISAMTKFDYKFSCSQWLQVGLHFFLYLLLTCMSNFVLIWCYLLFDSQTYFSIIIFYYKILEFKHLVDDIAIDLWSSLNFASMKHIRRKCNSTLNFSKFISNKKILSEVIVQSSLLLNLVLSAIMSWPL